VGKGQPLTAAEKVINLAGIVLPFAAVIVAIVLLWNQAVSVHDLVILAVFYLATTFGVTVGYHRLLTHRSFSTSKPLEYAWAVLGSMAVEGAPTPWVADHRKHHANSDKEGDPHSPHVGFGEGALGSLRGLWHAHTGWLMSNWGRAEFERYAPELYEDRFMTALTKYYGVTMIITFGLPALIGYLITGTLAGAATGLLWGGFVRVFLVNHVTFSINSICHFMGRRRFDTDDESRNVWWIALPSMGEAWHHNHHAFPRSAVHGLSRWELDPSAWLIAAMEKTGLAWNVVRIAPERQAAKAAEAAEAAASKPPAPAPAQRAAEPVGAGRD
jgi:stearoyl-CoA desaturase (delta-9 desaturase)